MEFAKQSPEATKTSKPIFGVCPIDKESFFTIDDDDLLLQIRSKFSPELDRLKRAYSISDRDVIHPFTSSPSQILYGAKYEEVNRTLVSVLSLRWIYRDQYQVFTRSQPDHVVLARSSFDWLRNVFRKRLERSEDVYALLVYIMVNDLGKDSQLASDVFCKTGEDIAALNHDIILVKAVEAGLVPCVDSLPQRHKDEIVRGIRLGAEFNPGQLAQAENAPACLSSLLEMRGHRSEFDFHFMQQLLDISGAAGHEDWTCAKKFIQPIAEAYQHVYEVAVDIISGDQGVREGYDVILCRRSEMLHSKGFRSLCIAQPEDRALMRLLCMGGVSDLEKAELYWSTWQALDDSTKGSLVYSLNIDGSSTEPAVQPTYMPAMLTQGIGQANSSREEKTQRLRSILQYLSRVLALVEEDKFDDVLVIERSVLWVVKNIVQSPAFWENPTILERADVPESTVAKSA